MIIIELFNMLTELQYNETKLCIVNRLYWYINILDLYLQIVCSLYSVIGSLLAVVAWRWLRELYIGNGCFRTEILTMVECA